MNSKKKVYSMTMLGYTVYVTTTPKNAFNALNRKMNKTYGISADYYSSAYTVKVHPKKE